MVGVILNLAVWFGLHVLFDEVVEIALPGMTIDAPVWTSLDVFSLALTLVAFAGVFLLRIGTIPVLALCSVLGVIVHLASGVN